MTEPASNQIEILSSDGEQICVLDFTDEEYEGIIQAALTLYITTVLREALGREESSGS